MMPTDGPQRDHRIDVTSGNGGEFTFAISGRIALDNLSVVLSEIHGILERLTPSKLSIDLSGLEYLDSAGALALVQLENATKEKSIPFAFVNMTEKTRGIMDLLDRDALMKTPLMEKRGVASIIEQVGEETARFFNDFVQLVTFLGELLSALTYSLLHPRQVRWDEVLFHMKRAGVDGLPIVGFINFLLGFVIGIMAAVHLVQSAFGIYLGSMVAIAMVKEFGPIMTAIVVAGRTGSAFAATIGTMAVNEEINALMTMGFDPIKFLAVPRILAVILVVPLLTLYADFLGVLGGLIVGVIDLDLAPYVYFKQIQHDLTVYDVAVSVVKTAVFAVIIAGVGCQRGFQVKGGAEGVGTTTTSAAVTAIFLVIVVDAIIAEAARFLY